jgi:hypothetical protein
VPYNGGIVAYDDHIRVALDRALSDVRAPLENAVRGLAQTVAAEATDERARAAQTEIDEVCRAAEVRIRELRASATRLSDAIRSLDEARSLGDVLNVLADCSRREADRIAVLVVKGGRLRGYRWSGFSGAAHAHSIDLSTTEAGFAGAIVQTGTMALRPAADPATSNPHPGALPHFAKDGGVRDAAALPIVLGGTVAAVLYADSPASDDALKEWSAALDLLTRHASRVLEGMTIRHITGLSPAPAPHRLADGDRASPVSVW